MEPEDKTKAIALVRAGVEEDHEALAYLLHEPPTQGLMTALTAMAASIIEETHGSEGAVERLDLWARVAYAEACVEESQ